MDSHWTLDSFDVVEQFITFYQSGVMAYFPKLYHTAHIVHVNRASFNLIIHFDGYQCKELKTCWEGVVWLCVSTSELYFCTFRMGRENIVKQSMLINFCVCSHELVRLHECSRW